ncbi:phosphotransferase [Candidatus Methylacidiphilum infernorum]|uniref:Maltokinase n=1 Tax=Methylacidiphilum infernorum (isolate V4) TaxID=481448 RepID=B3DYJ7_METI4|nr:phosphotransferase [Candidatus Methylacidiphilum infernorum]ACD84045.1 Uncharacterized domain involved in trehalose biosynthesis [Methylacidiphilum infernorum V4]
MRSFFWLTPPEREAFTEALRVYLPRCRWFASKSKSITKVDVEEEFCLDHPSAAFSILLVRVYYDDGLLELYSLPLEKTSSTEVGNEERLFFDERSSLSYREATARAELGQLLFELIVKGREVQGGKGKMQGYGSPFLLSLDRNTLSRLQGQFLAADQSNSAYILGQEFFLKLYRKLEPGENPETEILSFLTERSSFSHVPAYRGKIEARIEGLSYTLGLLSSYVPSLENGWKKAQEALSRFIRAARLQPNDETGGSGFSAMAGGAYFGPDAALIGERTAGLHLALSRAQGIPSFEPQPLEKEDLYFLYEESIGIMKEKWTNAPSNPWFNAWLSRQNLSFGSLTERVRKRLEEKISALEAGCVHKIRIHGDYHLGQLLWTGSDYLVIDFEGEPNRAMARRKIKWPGLRDVAGMLRSFHYVAYSFAEGKEREGFFLKKLAELWYSKVSKNFLDAYRRMTRGSILLPTEEKNFRLLLDFFLLEKAVYEVGYELGSRPSWVGIPLSALLELIR